MSSPLFEEWRRFNKRADEDTEQEIERFSREQNLDEDDRKYLKSAYGLAPQETTPSYDVGSTSLDNYFGLGYEQFEADLGAGLKEAAPRVVKDLGGPDWLGTGLQKFGEYLDEDTEEELAQYEGLPAPPTREDYIKEGGIGGFLYGMSPEYTPTPEQFTLQIPGSLAPSVAGAAGALSTFALTRNPLTSGAAAMATSNAMASLQVAGSEYRQGLENPEIRDFLGVSRETPFKDLPVEQQQQVSDFSGNVSARALKTRPVTSGALEMIGANPFVPSMALRFLIDITTGTTSELMDREFSADYVVDEMVARGMSPGDAEDVRQRVLALGPSQKEVFVNALAQEIVLGGVGTVLEQGVRKIAGDPRIDTFQTEMNNFQKEVIEGAQGDVQNERRKEETHRLKMAQQFQKLERERRKDEFESQERARKANQAMAEFDQKIQGRAAQSADFADLFERLTDTYGRDIGVNEFLQAFDLGPDIQVDLFQELARRGNQDAAFLKNIIDTQAKERADKTGLPEPTGEDRFNTYATDPKSLVEHMKNFVSSMRDVLKNRRITQNQKDYGPLLTGQLRDLTDYRIDAHGIAKGAQDQSLLNILMNGVDPNKPFHTTELIDRGAGTYIGAAGGPYMNGNYIILGVDQGMIGDGIQAVLVNDGEQLFNSVQGKEGLTESGLDAQQRIEFLQEQFPNIDFVPFSEAREYIQNNYNQTQRTGDRAATIISGDAQRAGGRRRVDPLKDEGKPGFQQTAEEKVDRSGRRTGFQQTAEDLVDKPIFSYSQVETAAEMEAQEGLGEAIDEGPQGVPLTKRQFKLVTERLKKAFGPLKDKIVVFDTLEEAYMFGGDKAVESEGFVIDSDPETPIYLVRENIKGADPKDAVARAVKVFFHESIGHRGIHGIFGGENSPDFRSFTFDFYRTNRKKVDKWLTEDPRGMQYNEAIDNDKRLDEGRKLHQKIKEYIAINLAEQGPRDLSLIDSLGTAMNAGLRKYGLSSAITEKDAVSALLAAQKELTGVGNQTVLFGKMGPPVVRGGADAQEPTSQSRISRRDEEQFYGFQGKSKLSRYAKPERKRTRKSREDAFRDVDDDLDRALVSESWPKKLVKDLIQFDRLEPEYARGLAEALKSSNQGPAAKALAKRVLERAREGYQKQKTAQLSKEQMDALTSAPEDISYGKRENRSIRTARLFERLRKTEPAISQSLARKKKPATKTVDGDNYADFILNYVARRERGASDIAPFASPAEEEDFVRGVSEQGIRTEPGMEADLESKKSREARAKRLLKERAAEKRRKQRVADAKARKEARQKRIAKDPQDRWLDEKREFLRGRGFTDDKLADVELSDSELKRIEAGETFQGPAAFAGTPMFSPSLLTEPRKTLTTKNLRNNRQHNADQGFASAPDRMMDIWHYSQRNDLSEIDPDFYGTGIKGEELKDKQFPDWINRSYWGHTGYRREMGLPPYKYSLRLDHGRLYDLFGDPMGLKSVAREAGTPNFGNTYEKAIYQAGFDGYWVSEDAGGVMDAIAMFVPQTPNKFEWLPQGDQLDLREISPEPAELMSFSKMKKPPKKTMTAYKLFRLKKSKPGKIFPLFATDEPVEIGQWIRAKFVPREKMPNKAQKMKLAPRGGWHSAEEPAAHLKTTMASGEVRVWAEVEIGDDVEWQSKADATKTKDIRNAVPRGGQYRFKRPANQGGFWRISGEMKVNRILSQEEVQQLDPNAPSVISQSYAGIQGIKGDTDAQNALVQAKAMELDNKPMDEIMAATGWFRFDAATGKERGKKGMWRYKFPNTDVRMKAGTRGQRPIQKELHQQFFTAGINAGKNNKPGTFDYGTGLDRRTWRPLKPSQIERYYVSELAPNLMEDFEGAAFETRISVGDVFDLGRLGQMYPSLNRIPIRFDNTEDYGSAMVGIDSRTIEQGRKNFKAGNKKDPGIKMFMIIGLGRPNPDGINRGFQQEWISDMMREDPQLTSLTGTVLHELQHAIQHLEGFSSGGSPDDFRSMAYDKIMQDFGKMATETWQQMIPWHVRNDIGETFFALLDQHRLGGRTSRERKKNAVKAGFSIQTEPVTYPDMAGRDVTKNAFFQESPFGIKAGSTPQQIQNWAPKLEPRYLNVLAEAVSDVVHQGRVDVFQQTHLQNWFSNLKNYLQHPQELVEQQSAINYLTTVGEIEARDVEQEYRDFVHENDSLSNVPAANHGFGRARRPWILGGIERGTAAARNFEALGTDFHAPWQRSMMISQSMKNLETEMRARQIEQLPKGSPQRISAIRALRRFYMLNPTSDTWLDTGYEEELKNAPPEQYSWSLLIKGDNPTPREKKLIIELLEKGKLFIDPSVFRAMLGDKPNALPIVMDFFKVQRDKVLKGQMSFRDAYKAHVLTTASQGMSGNSPWSPFEKTAGVLNMPDKFGSLTKGFRKSNLADFANKLNQETGRSTYEGKQLTETEVMQYYNKAPLVTVEDLPLNDSLHSSEAADPAFADIKKDLLNIADEFNGKKNSADRIMDFKTAVKMFQQGQKVKYQAGMAMDYGDTKPNISINPEYTALKKKYNLTDEQLKPVVPQKMEKGKPVVDNKGNPSADLKADTFIEINGENIYVPPKHLFNITREPTERHHYGRHTYIVGKKSKRVKKYLEIKAKEYKGEKSPGKPSGIRQGTTKLSELQKLYKDKKPTKIEDYQGATVESRPAGKTLSLWFRDPGKDKKPMPLTKGRTKGGVWVPNAYAQDDGKIRAEDGMAYWFSTDQGQEALAYAELAEKFYRNGNKPIQHNGTTLTQEDWEKGMAERWRGGGDIRTAMGDDRIMLPILGKEFEDAKRTGDKWTLTLTEWVDFVNDKAKSYGNKLIENPGDSEKVKRQKAFDRFKFSRELSEETKKLSYISVGKEGFFKHHLGLGDSPTVDAIEKAVLIAGTPNLNWDYSPLITQLDPANKLDEGDPMEFRAKGPRKAVGYKPGDPMYYYPDKKKGDPDSSWRRDFVNKAFAKMDIDQLMKDKMMEYYTQFIYKTPPTYNDDGTVKSMGVKNKEWKDYDDDVVFHFIHHWMWDRAKGITQNSQWPTPGTKPNAGEIGGTEMRFRPGIYQAMLKDHHVLDDYKTQLQKGINVLSYSRMLLNRMEPNTSPKMVTTWSEDLKPVLSQSLSFNGLTDQEIDRLFKLKHQISIADRLRGGVYQPMDPNNTLLTGANEIYLMGGWAYPNFNSMLNAGAGWAADAPGVITGHYNLRDEENAPFVDILLMGNDAHFGNKQTWQVIEKEIDWMIQSGQLGRNVINKIFDDMIANKATPLAPGSQQSADGSRLNFKAWGNANKKVASTPFLNKWNDMKQKNPKSDAWDIFKKMLAIPSGTSGATTFGNRLQFAYFLFGNWSDTTNGFIVNPSVNQDLNTLGNYIWDNTVDMREAPQHALVGTLEIHPDADNPNISAQALGIPTHPAYSVILPGKPVATFDIPIPREIYLSGQHPGNWLQAMNDFLDKQEQAGKAPLGRSNLGTRLTTVMGVREPIKKTKASAGRFIEGPKGSDFTILPMKKTEVSPPHVGSVLSKFGQPYVWPDSDTMKRNLMAAYLSPHQIMGASFSMMPGGRAVNTQNAPVDQMSSSLVKRYQRFMRNKITKYLEPMGKLPGRQDYLKLRRLAKGAIHEAEEFGKDLYKILSKTKSPKQIYDYLTTRGADPNQILDPKERAAAVSAKERINAIGQELLNKGLIHPGTIQRYGDRYLPRVYLKYLLKEVDQNRIAMGQKPSDLGYLKQRKYIGRGVRELILGEVKDPGFLASRATMLPARDLALLDWLGKIAINPQWALQRSLVDFDVQGEMAAIAPELVDELQLSDTSSHRVTPYWLKSEANRLRSTIMPTLEGDKLELANQLTKRMDEVANEAIGAMAADVPENYKQMPTSARYGKLRGMVVRKEIYDDIVGSMKFRSGDESLAEQVLGDTGFMGGFGRYWKWVKVSANPPSWVRNFVSNLVLMNLGGVPMYRIPDLFLTAIQDIKNNGTAYKLVQDRGLAAGTFANVELGRIERHFTDLQARMRKKKQHPMAWAGMIKNTLQKFQDKTSDWYGSIDVLGKTMAVKWAMESGVTGGKMNADQAVDFAEKWLFDYSLVKPSVRYLRSAAFGSPFITFTSKVAPLMLETIMTKPWKLAPYYMLGWGMKEMFLNNLGLDDEEYEGLKESLNEYLRDKSKSGVMPASVIPLPVKDEQDRIQFFDVSYLYPWGMFSELFSEISDGDIAAAMSTLGMLGGPMANMSAAILTNTDPFTRKEIINELDGTGKKFADLWWYGFNLATPPMIHSDFGAATRMLQTFRGDLTPEGEPRFTYPQGLSRLGGFNITPVDPQEARSKNARFKQSQILKLMRERSRRYRDLVGMKRPKEEIQEEMSDYTERIKEMREDYKKWLKLTKVPKQLKRAS